MALTVAAAVWIATMSSESQHWLRNAGAIVPTMIAACLLYTSDAADEL